MLRQYQQFAFDEAYKWIKTSGKSNLCVDMPTGSGKSHVIAYMCKTFLGKWPEVRVLMLTHVKELLEQNMEKMLQYWPNAPVGMYSASVGKKVLGEPITFAGVQSIINKLEGLGFINLIIIDECHLVSHKDEGSYRKIINFLKQVNPRLKVVGFTATPYRLGHGYIDAGSGFFDEIISPVNVMQLIRDGFLSPLKSKSTEYEIDASSVKKRGGEYIESELQNFVNTDENNSGCVDEIIRRSQGRKSWIVFCTGVDHALSVRDEFLKKGISAACISGSTPKKERAEIIGDFKSGKYKALTNVNVLTTGFDAPNIDLIALLRPTLSTAMHVQQLGRGTRLKTSGAADCLVLDFVGNIMKHGGIAGPNVDGEGKGSEEGDIIEKEGVAPMKPCPECHEIVHIRVMTCTDCGYEFPASEEQKGSGHIKAVDLDTSFCPVTGKRQDENIISTVRKWKWQKHTSKASGREMLRIDYFLSDFSAKPVSEYFNINDDGKSGDISRRNLTKLVRDSGICFSTFFKYDDIEDSARIANITSKPPRKLTYVANGNFYQVKSREWGESYAK